MGEQGRRHLADITARGITTGTAMIKELRRMALEEARYHGGPLDGQRVVPPARAICRYEDGRNAPPRYGDKNALSGRRKIVRETYNTVEQDWDIEWQPNKSVYFKHGDCYIFKPGGQTCMTPLPDMGSAAQEKCDCAESMQRYYTKEDTCSSPANT